MDTDRNLLFGVLALQADLISSEQFAEACSVWAARKHVPLADVLVERGWLSPGDVADVEKLLERKISRHDGDVRASLAEVANDRVRQSLAGLADAEIQQTLAGATPPPHGHVLMATTDFAPELGERYTLSRLHATGGIGRVWLARDASLGRDVALKELRPEQAGHPTVWARFLREAQITGQLEHPGIVPVYELGKRPGAEQPFYTMRFVRGRTLAEAARAYHQRRQRGEATSLDLRELLTAFVGVCNAVAYAHSRRVLHRDLKPQNVVLGDYGEVIVLDWGLARLVDESDDGPAAERPPVALPGDASRDETMAGAVLGTPAYMAPEQAEGRVDLIDFRADVYGLGAILYEILTGRPPFTGDKTEAVLRRVVHEPPEPPRWSVAQTPPPLEAICLKALAKKPADRYGTAKEVAAEVQHWLADEPIQAYREPLPARAGRWARRHRTLVAVAASLLVVGTVGLGISTLLVNRQRERAEENAQMARDAVDDMYTQVAEKWLSQEAQLEDVQRDFLEKALRFYERLAASEGSSVEVRREAGKAARRAAEIQDRLGDSAAAAVSYRRAVEVLQPLAGDDVAFLELAHAYNGHAWFLWMHGKNPDETIQQALDIAEELSRRRPDLRQADQVAAGAHSRFGIIHAARGRLRDAEKSHLKTLSLRVMLAKENPAQPDERLSQARTHANLVSVYRQLGRYREADSASERGVAICEDLVKEFGRNPHYRADLIRNLDERANLVALLGRRKEAESLLRRAVDEADRLVADFPASTAHHDAASSVRRDLAILARDRGKMLDAEPSLRRAVAEAEALTTRNPDKPIYWRSLAVHRSNLGDLLHSAGRPKESRVEYDKALAIVEDLAARQPDILDYRTLRVLYRSSTAFLDRAAGRFKESDAAYTQVIGDLERLIREFPEMPQLRASLASALYQKGEVLTIMKQVRDGETHLDRAIREADALIREYGLPSHHGVAGSASAVLAQHAIDRGDAARARTLLEQANRHLDVMLQVHPDDNGPRFQRMRNLGLLAQVQAKASDFEGIDGTARELDCFPRSAIEHYNASCFLALGVAALKESREAGPERDQRAKAIADLAVDQLAKAIVAGYRNLPLIKTDPDLNALRDRADFRKLVADLEQKEKSKSGK